MVRSFVMMGAAFLWQSYVAILFGINFAGNLTPGAGNRWMCVFSAMPKARGQPTCTAILAQTLHGQTLNSKTFGIGRKKSFLTDYDPRREDSALLVDLRGWLFLKFTQQKIILCMVRSMVGPPWVCDWYGAHVHNAQLQPWHSPKNNRFVAAFQLCLVHCYVVFF